MGRVRLRAFGERVWAGGMLAVLVLGAAAAVAFGLAIGVLILTADLPVPVTPAGHH